MPYFYVHSARERLCHAGRLPEIYCNHTLIARAFNPSADFKHDQEFSTLFMHQKIDAIIYIIIVLIFYTAIITIVLVTNCHRFRSETFQFRFPMRRKHLLVNSDSSLRILDPTKDVPNYLTINENSESNV